MMGYTLQENTMSVTLTYRDGAAVITLNRPEAMNALNAEMIHSIGALIDEAGDSDASVLIVVGAGGKAFCAGADVTGILGRDADAQRAFARLGQRTFARLDALRMPSIAVISGVAFGGGLELALACTFRVATPAARLALPEIRLGLIPGYGGTQRLSRLIGPARALAMITTGRAVRAEEAVRLGLVNAVAEGDDPVALGSDFASALGNPPPAAFALARDAVLQGFDMALASGLELEAELFAAVTQTKDATEGVGAFLGKRQPVFVGH